MLGEIFSIYILVEAIWLILPAFAANGLVPLFKGSHPIDGGRRLGKNFILGPGKTWEGLIAGSVIGVVIALVQQAAFPYLPWDISPVSLTIVPMTAQLGLLLGFGAMFGDAAGSFIKRRFGIKRGDSAPLLDQEDFLLGSLLFSAALVTPHLEWAIILLIITPIIHYAACLVGYAFKIKKTPY